MLGAFKSYLGDLNPILGVLQFKNATRRLIVVRHNYGPGLQRFIAPPPFHSIRHSVLSSFYRPSTLKKVVDTLCAQLLLQFYADSLETSQMFLSWSDLVWFDAQRLGKQFFSHVGTEPPLPGYYQYFLG